MDFYKFTLKRMDKYGILRFVITFFTALLSNVVIVLTPIIQKRLLNSISSKTMDSKDIAALGVISIVGILAVILEGVLLNQLFMIMQRSLQRELLENSIRNETGIIKSKGPGAYMVSVFGDSEHIAGIITTNIFGVLLQCVMAIVILVISLQWDSLFVCIVIPSYILMIAIHIYFDKKYIACYQKGREYVYEINPKVLEYIENRSSVLSYSSIREYEESMYGLFDKRDNCFKNASIISSLSASLNSAIKTGSLVIFFVLALFKIQSGAMDVSTFIALVSYFGIIFQPITSIKGLSANFHKFKTMKEKIKSSLQEDLRFQIPHDSNISFEDCSVEYDGKVCINNFSLAIDKRIGLVGLSGEGKTTIIKLLLGELDPTSGLCKYGGINISKVSRYVTRTEIRYYSQNIEIFDEDVEFNVTLGKKGVSSEQYEKLLKEQQNLLRELRHQVKENNRIDNKKEYAEVIQTLFLVNKMQLKRKDVLDCICDELLALDDATIETVSSILVSRRYYIIEKYKDLAVRLGLEKLEGRKLGQRGSKISGGEKNRIAMARFLLPEHGKYFILDEPFTNLDLVAEAECLSVLNDYIGDKKGIIISHKLNVIKSVSEDIIVLENGRISERGSHDVLVKKDGLYNTLYKEYERGLQ